MDFKDQFTEWKWKLQDRWNSLEPAQKRLVPMYAFLPVLIIVFLVVIVNWWRSLPAGPAAPRIDAAALKQQQDAAASDEQRLAAMSPADLKAEIKTREAAVKAAFTAAQGKMPPGAPVSSPELNQAQAALTRAQNALTEKGQ